MADIKVKEKVKGTIKTLDRTAIASQKLKDNVILLNEKADETYSKTDDTNVSEYAQERYSETVNYGVRKGINKFNEYGKKSVRESKQNIEKGVERVKAFKNKVAKKKEKEALEKSAKRSIKGVTKTGKRYIKTASNTSGKAIKTTENVVKNTERNLKASVKAAQRTAKIIKASAKAAAKATKATIKAVISAIKAIISATKALIAFLFAGGWIVVVIILVICMIAMIISSVFGIFFSSEDTGSTITVDGVQQPITMSQVISDLNIEFMNKITQIQQENPYDEYDITGSRAEWKDILAVYIAKVSNGNDQVEMMTLNDDKVNTLKEIFWKMNEVTFTKDETSEEKVVIHLTSTEHITETHTKLHITINSKSKEDMANEYNFTEEQRKQLAEFSSDSYASMWSAVIYGSSAGSNDIVQVAISQIGNVGGQPYWNWYGFNERVSWCACFVSWCANECGYIDSGVIPRFSVCQTEGITWFKTCGLWKDRGYSPKARRYNLF